MDGEVCPGQIDGERSGPLLRGQVVDRCPDPVNASVCNDNVQSSKLLYQSGNSAPHLVFRGNVGVKNHRLAVRLKNICDRRHQFVMAVPKHADSKPVCRQSQGRRPAYP